MKIFQYNHCTPMQHGRGFGKSESMTNLVTAKHIKHTDMKHIVITGATSGIGLRLAEMYLQLGWTVGAAGRNTKALEALAAKAPEKVFTKQIDITSDEAPDRLMELIGDMGGTDVYFHSSGIGYYNPSLDFDKEIQTTETNVKGFTQMVNTAYTYFRKKGGGHIAVISSVAGTKGLGAAPAYSATKRYQRHYIDALAQNSHMTGANVSFTDIRPGFVDTPLLRDGKYPLLMDCGTVARHIMKAVDRKKRSLVIDWKYAVVVFLWHLIPEWIWERMPVK